jgi:outer membrane receptor protein involved in Fe transport
MALLIKRGHYFALLLGASSLATAVQAAGPLPPSPTPSSANALEADAQPFNDSDIVVTARRKTERLQDVPVTVNVVGAESLQQKGVRDFLDATKLVPMLTITPTGSGAGGNIQIRGIGTLASDQGIDQFVAVNVDGEQISRSRSILATGLFDIQSMEVLKGPQALFFGKNSPGGVITLNSVSPVPGGPANGYLRAAYNGLDKGYVFEGATNINLGETLAIRVAGRYDDSRGYIRNYATGGPDRYNFSSPGVFPFTVTAGRKWGPGTSNLIGRFTAVYRPDDAFSATFKLYGDRFRDNGYDGARVILGCGTSTAANPTVVTGTPALADPFQGCRPGYDKSVTVLDPAMRNFLKPGYSDKLYDLEFRNSFSHITTVVSSLNMEYKADKFTLTSLTGFFYFKYLGSGDGDYTSIPAVIRTDDQHQRTISEELRLNSSLDGAFNFVAGAFFEDSRRRIPASIKVFQAGPDPVTGRFDSYATDWHNNGRTYSVFGQAILDITPELILTGGARYTHETRFADLLSTYVIAIPSIQARYKPVGTHIAGNLSSNNVSPEATLTYKPSSDLTVYGAYKTGFISAGFSNNGAAAVTQTVANSQYKAAIARGGEIGVKSQAFGGRLTTDISVYLYNYTDLQLTSFDASALSYIVKNAGSARSKGFEIFEQYRVDAATSLRGWLAYNKARFRSFPNAQCYSGQTAAQGCVVIGGVAQQNLSGKRIGASPDFMASAGATHSIPLTAEWNLVGSIDGTYQTKFNHSAGASNFRDSAVTGDQFLLSGSIAVESGRFSVRLIGNNITNRRYIISSSDNSGTAPGTQSGFLSRPRELVLEARAKF